MRAALATLPAVLVGVVIGIGGTLAVRRAWPPTRANGRGQLVTCNRLDRTCWQAGTRVKTPHEGDACTSLDPSAGGEGTWKRLGAARAPQLFHAWVCTP